MKSVTRNSVKQNHAPRTMKGEAVREFSVLCCVLFFLLQIYSSFFHLQQADLSPFQLQAISHNSLALIKKPYENSMGGNDGGMLETQASLTPFFFEPLPLNYSDKQLLQSIAGIGPGLAGNIVETRERIGFFRSQRDLLQVSGIGESLMHRFASDFSFEVYSNPVK